MSIRLRLTLVYTAILAFTLIIFGFALYKTQENRIIAEYKQRLNSIERFIRSPDGLLLSFTAPPALNRRFPTPFYIQLRLPSGKVLRKSQNFEDIDLPLDEKTVAAAQAGQIRQDLVFVDGNRYLIRNYPVKTNNITAILQVAIPLADQDQSLHTLRRILTTGSAIAVVLAFGVGWLMTGLTLRPINRLTKTAKAIGAERNFSRRVDYSGPNDEIGQLANTFNVMLSELQTAFLQVESALQQQRRFASDASHELRTPLTTIRGNIGLLQRAPPISEADKTDALADMLAETDRLNRLVNNLLTLARSDAQRPLQQQNISLFPLLHDVCRQARLLAPEQKIICKSVRAATVPGDEDALKQVLLILLDNALKHNDNDDLRVTLKATVEAGRAVITVADNGRGINPDALPHIFERFYRGDAARNSGGAGLGLSIARELVEAHHGRISAQSTPEQGSIFTVSLPIVAN